MTHDGTTDPQVFYPSLRYRDANAAIEWLERAFGFSALEVHRGDGGEILHAEVGYGDGMVMLGSEPDGGDPMWGEHAGQGWTYVVTDEPDALFERATAAGAEVVRPLTDQDYGSRDFSVRDLEGNVWSFGTYGPER
jgi:uncharacterized glyoxalase superfamily protein PhnB